MVTPVEAQRDARVLMERDDATGIARVTINNPERRNCYDPPMRAQLGAYLDELASDDRVKVVVLRVEQLQAYHGEEVASYLFHAFGTNLQFEDDEFNFVKTRAQVGTKRAFEMRDAHFDVPEPRGEA